VWQEVLLILNSGLVALLTRAPTHAFRFGDSYGTHAVRAAVQAGAAITRVVGIGSVSPADVDLWTGHGLTSNSVLPTRPRVWVPRLSWTNIRKDKQ
jgi:hypothetical protein